MDADQLRRQLSAIEPNESMYDGISADDVPRLKNLLGDAEPWMASRAVWALAHINDVEAAKVLAVAAEDARPEVRVSVAASTPRLTPGVADSLLLRLLDDSDLGVRKFSLLSASSRNSTQVIERVRRIATSDAEPALRGLAAQQIRSINR